MSNGPFFLNGSPCIVFILLMLKQPTRYTTYAGITCGNKVSKEHGINGSHFTHTILHCAKSVDVFKVKLKTHLFGLTFLLSQLRFYLVLNFSM